MTAPCTLPPGSFYVELEAQQQYWWCTCGFSAKQPFCDGTHKGSSFKSLPFQVNQKQTVALCGCKKTKTPPYCDGSHTD